MLKSRFIATTRGFTIVELLVIIVVIGILALISTVAYSGVSQRAVVASLQTDLNNSAKKLALYQVDNSAYPTSVTDCPTPAAGNTCLKASPGNSYLYVPMNGTNPQTFSLTATNTNGSSYGVTNNSGPVSLSGPVATATPGNTTINATAASTSQVNLTWLAASDATSYQLQRATNSTFTSPTSQTLASTPLSLSVAGLSASTTYYFRIQALNGSVTGNWSSTDSARTADVYVPPYVPPSLPTPPAPTYAGSTSHHGASSGAGSYPNAMTNYTTSCTSGNSVINGTYTSYEERLATTRTGQPFGHWDVFYSYGPTDPVYVVYSGARYQCQASDGTTSPYSPTSGSTRIPIYMN